MNVELTNMVMIEDPVTYKVLVQNRVKSWKGLSFPGGHVDKDESFYDSAVREVKEETGLDITNLKSCGVIHWVNNMTYDRYIAFLYKTNEFTRELILETEEGVNTWMTIEEIRNTPNDNGLSDYLPMFFDIYSEAYAPYNVDKPFKVIFR